MSNKNKKGNRNYSGKKTNINKQRISTHNTTRNINKKGTSYTKKETKLITLEQELKKDIIINNDIPEIVPVKVKPKVSKEVIKEVVEPSIEQKEILKVEEKVLDTSKELEQPEEQLPQVKKKEANKKFILNTLIVVSIILIVSSLSLIIFNVYTNYTKGKEEQQLIEENNRKIAEIKSHYNKYVRTNKTTKLYVLEKKQYREYGEININIELTLVDIKDDEFKANDDYFEIEGLDAYIRYSDVDKIESLTPLDNHYKKYVVFNTNIVTNNKTNFYNDNGLVYSINKSFSLPIIIKETDRYYVEYNNQLLYVKKRDVKETISSSNTTTKTRNNIRTLAYHFVYDPKTEKCDNYTICHTEEQFNSHMKYISENNYFSLTMKDMELFLDKKIQIPAKSILITIDDGWYVARSIKILEQYKVNATLFLITSLAPPSDYKSNYLEVHSHSHNLHTPYVCNTGSQGGGILCLPKEEVLADLKKSREILNNSTVFCYPFYDYNDYAISLLKEAGFKMAFAGTGGVNGIANQSTNKYKIPRTTIFSTTTMNEFKSILNY